MDFVDYVVVFIMLCFVADDVDKVSHKVDALQQSCHIEAAAK